MKRCQSIVRPANSFKEHRCGKEAVLYLKDLKPLGTLGKHELYLCAVHAHHILKVLFGKKI